METYHSCTDVHTVERRRTCTEVFYGRFPVMMVPFRPVGRTLFSFVWRRVFCRFLLLRLRKIFPFAPNTSRHWGIVAGRHGRHRFLLQGPMRLGRYCCTIHIGSRRLVPDRDFPSPKTPASLTGWVRFTVLPLLLTCRHQGSLILVARVSVFFC